MKQLPLFFLWSFYSFLNFQSLCQRIFGPRKRVFTTPAPLQIHEGENFVELCEMCQHVVEMKLAGSSCFLNLLITSALSYFLTADLLILLRSVSVFVFALKGNPYLCANMPLPEYQKAVCDIGFLAFFISPSEALLSAPCHHGIR